jgi:hypothetical protein
VFYSRNWPFVWGWADRFATETYFADANGNIICRSFGGNGYSLNYPDTIYNDSLPPFYINYIYFNPYTNSIPKSLAAAGLEINEGFIINQNTVMAPASLEIIDPLGRRVFNSNWPEENRLFLPQYLHGVLLLRLRYGNEQVSIVRHGFD